MESDQEYFWRRYEQARAAAERSADERARRAHLELSARYAQLAAAIEEADQPTGLLGKRIPIWRVSPPHMD